jgi:hypothetical protein
MTCRNIKPSPQYRVPQDVLRRHNHLTNRMIHYLPRSSIFIRGKLKISTHVAPNNCALNTGSLTINWAVFQRVQKFTKHRCSLWYGKQFQLYKLSSCELMVTEIPIQIKAHEINSTFLKNCLLQFWYLLLPYVQWKWHDLEQKCAFHFFSMSVQNILFCDKLTG